MDIDWVQIADLTNLNRIIVIRYLAYMQTLIVKFYKLESLSLVAGNLNNEIITNARLSTEAQVRESRKTL